jgi:hypothetical protein
MVAVALNPNNGALPINTQNPQALYLGPTLSNDFERLVPRPFSENVAPAYAPSAFLWTYAPTASEADRKVIKAAPVEQLLNKPQVNLQLLRGIEEDIKNHFEMRVQLIFQQLLLVYSTNIVFRFCNKAVDQVGSTDISHSFRILDEGRYAAAHSSTIPCLRVENTASTVESVVFARGSFFFNCWNATVFLPEKVNIIDSALDRTRAKCHNAFTFRERCTQIINRASIGNTTPYAGLHEFLDFAIAYTQELLASENDEEKQYILQTYLSTAKNSKNKIDEKFAKQLCFATKSPLEGVALYSSVHKEMFDKMLKEITPQEPADQLNQEYRAFKTPQNVVDYFKKNPIACIYAKAQTYASHLAKLPVVKTLAMNALKGFSESLKTYPNITPNYNQFDLQTTCKNEICKLYHLKRAPNHLATILNLVMEKIAKEKE